MAGRIGMLIQTQGLLSSTPGSTGPTGAQGLATDQVLTTDSSTYLNDQSVNFFVSTGAAPIFALSPSGVYINAKMYSTDGIDPTYMQFTEYKASQVPTGNSKGAIYVSDGSDGQTSNHLVYKDQNNILHDLLETSQGPTGPPGSLDLLATGAMRIGTTDQAPISIVTGNNNALVLSSTSSMSEGGEFTFYDTQKIWTRRISIPVGTGDIGIATLTLADEAACSVKVESHAASASEQRAHEALYLLRNVPGGNVDVQLAVGTVLDPLFDIDTSVPNEIAFFMQQTGEVQGLQIVFTILAGLSSSEVTITSV